MAVGTCFAISFQASFSLSVRCMGGLHRRADRLRGSLAIAKARGLSRAGHHVDVEMFAVCGHRVVPTLRVY